MKLAIAAQACSSTTSAKEIEDQKNTSKLIRGWSLHCPQYLCQCASHCHEYSKAITIIEHQMNMHVNKLQKTHATSNKSTGLHNCSTSILSSIYILTFYMKWRQTKHSKSSHFLSIIILDKDEKKKRSKSFCIW